MFNSLTSKLKETFRRLAGKGKIRKEDLDEAVRSIKLSLLEADVNYKVVQELTTRISEKIVGLEALPTLKPEEHFLAVVHQELVEILGQPFEPNFAKVLLVGLQGAGKTTTCAKLGRWLQQRRAATPLLVPVDVRRPAAIQQLQLLGQRYGVSVFAPQTGASPLQIAQAADQQHQPVTREHPLLIDTAGRLQIDDELMDEVAKLSQKLQPTATLLVLDAMTGQQAVNVAKAFHEKLRVDGIILTKIEGDARGGAALSIRAVTQIPIVFLGVGESPDDLELYDPTRLVNRILDKGDLTGLVDKLTSALQQPIDNVGAADIESPGSFKDFTLEAFLKQLRWMKRLGPLEGLVGLLPGFSNVSKKLDFSAANDELKRYEAMVQSMTVAERRDLRLLNGRRRLRIARGSGTKVEELNRFLKRFEEMQKMFKKMSAKGMGGGNFSPEALKRMLGR